MLLGVEKSKCARCDYDFGQQKEDLFPRTILPVWRDECLIRYWVCDRCHAPGEKIVDVVSWAAFWDDAA
jgi:hypothetical protein